MFWKKNECLGAPNNLSHNFLGYESILLQDQRIQISEAGQTYFKLVGNEKEGGQEGGKW